MKISSNYYYPQSSLQNTLSSATVSSSSSDSSQSDSAVKSATSRRLHGSTSAEELMAMSMSMGGQMMKMNVQPQSSDSSDFSATMEKIKTDMDAIKTSDLSCMTEEEMRTALTNLQSDLKGVSSPDGSFEEIASTDVSSLSADEVQNMLQTIQERAQSAPQGGMGPGGKPPMGPPPGGMQAGGASGSQDISQILSSLLDSESDDDTDSLLEEILASLTSGYSGSTSGTDSTSSTTATTATSSASSSDSSTGSQTSEEYASQLKEKLTALFTQRKNDIDTMSNLLFEKLDTWSAKENASTAAGV